MTVSVSLAPDPVFQWLQNGVPGVGFKLFTYAAGTTTKQATYTDFTAGTPNTNPIILDANGKCDIWLDNSLTYKFVLAPANDTDPPTNPVWTVNHISPTAGGGGGGGGGGSNTLYGISPDQFGARSPDDTAIINAGLVAALAAETPLVFTSGVYHVSSPILLTQGANIIIEAGVTVQATSGFTGTSIFQLGSSASYNQFMTLSGNGTIDCNNLCNWPINIVQGSACQIDGLNLSNGILGGLKIGDPGSAEPSVQVNISNLNITQGKLVANSSGSIGLSYQNATDCFASQIISQGYRIGCQIDSTSASIYLSQVHCWGWSTNVAMTRAFDIQGSGNKLVQCYADTPFDTTGALGDLYGFYMHGFALEFVSCQCFMNTTMGSLPGQTNIATNGRLAVFGADRETFSIINGIVVSGGTIGTYDFKQLFESVSGSGFFNSTWCTNINDPGPTAYTSTTDRQINWPSTVNSYIMRGGLTCNQTMAVSSAAGVSIKYGIQTASANRWTVDKDSVAESGGNAGADFRIIGYDDTGAFLNQPITIVRSTGQVQLGYQFGSGVRVAVNSTATTTAPSAGGGGALPATPAGYVSVVINGTTRQIPYY